MEERAPLNSMAGTVYKCRLCGNSFTTSNPNYVELGLCPVCYRKLSEKVQHPQEQIWKAPEWTTKIPEKAIITEGENSLTLTGKVEIGPNPRNPDRLRAIIYTRQGLFYTGSLAIMVALKQAALEGPLKGRKLRFYATGEGVSRRYSKIRVE